MSDEQGVMINAAERAYIERLRSALEKCEGALREAREALDTCTIHGRSGLTCIRGGKPVKHIIDAALAAAEEAREK